MESKILKHQINPFLDREEFFVEVHSKTMPTKKEIILALKKDENLSVVKKVHTNFGKHSFIAEIFVYNSEKAKKKYMVIPKKIRNKLKEEAAAKKKEELAKKTEAK